MIKIKNKIYLLLFISSIFLFCCNKERHPKFTIGTKNLSGEVLRDVKLKMKPEGFDEPGILTLGQRSTYMYPRWPVPEKISLTFEDSKKQKHRFKLKTHLSKDFNGDIAVIIKKTNGKFFVVIKTGKLGELN